MYIGIYPLRSHLLNDLVAPGHGLSGESGQIQVAAGHLVLPEMGCHLHAAVLKQLVIKPHQGISFLQQLRIPAQLHQTDGRHDVRHIALIQGRHNIVFPCAGLGFGQRVLVLPVETQEHVLLIDRLVIQTQSRIPCGGAALGGGEILHRVERKRGEVRKAAGALAAAHGTEAVGAVSHHGHSADLLLQVISGDEQCLLALHDGINGVVVCQDAGNVHGDHRFGPLRNGGRQFLRIHLIGAGEGVHQHYRGAHMAHGAGGSGVGIGRGDDLVSGADAQNAQGHLQAGRGRIQAHRPIRSAVGRDLPLKFLGSGAGGDPAGAQGLTNLLYLLLGNVRGAERDFPHNFSSLHKNCPQKGHSRV